MTPFDRIRISALTTTTIGVLASAPAGAQTPNDATNYYGDKITFSVNVSATLSRDRASAVCVPAGKAMRVIGTSPDGDLLVHMINTGVPSCSASGAPIPHDESLTIAKADIGAYGMSRTGVTYGALVVPFKYHMTGEKGFTGGSTVGGYLGWRISSTNLLSVVGTPIVFLGASNLSVPSDADGKTQDVMGFSFGFGLIGTFKNSFQAGVVLGWDRVSKSTGYQYNGKPWLALEIGYSFLQ